MVGWNPCFEKCSKYSARKVLSESQRFAITFLLRDLIISKVTCMIQMFSLYMGERDLGPDQVSALLKTLKAQGNA
jgi:hypothetical protein